MDNVKSIVIGIGVSVVLAMVIVVAGGIITDMMTSESTDSDRTVIDELNEKGGTILLNESIGSSSYLSAVKVVDESTVSLNGSYIVVENTGYTSSVASGSTVWIPLDSVLYIRLNTE